MNVILLSCYETEAFVSRCEIVTLSVGEVLLYVDNSISKLQIQVTTYVFELSAGNCHR